MIDFKRKAAVIFCALLFCTAGYAGDRKDSESDYNLKKAYEVLRDDNDEKKALELVCEQLKQTPDNVRALLLKVRLLRNRGEYGDALTEVNRALKVNRPKRNGVFQSTLLYWKAALYEDLDEMEKSAGTYRTAISLAAKDNPDNLRLLSFDYAQVLYQLERYDDADVIYRKLLAADEAYQPAMVGLARNMIEREEYAEAAALCERCKKYDEDYSGSYRYAMLAYDGMGQTDKAIDNAVRLIEKDSGEMSESVAGIFMKHKAYSVAKIKEADNREHDNKWRMALALIYTKSCEYEKAIVEFDALEKEYGHDEFIYSQRAECYGNLGMVQTAISEIGKAIEMESDYSNWATLGTICREAGMYEEAIDALDRVIEKLPASAWGYYAKGWCYELSGDDGKAMKLYEEGIDIDKTYPYIYLMRGEQFAKRGEAERAAADFETVLQLDTLADNGSCRQYALHFLGRDDEALAWMDRIIEAEPYEPGERYDQACLLCRMGRCDDAVKAMEKAFEMGYCNFAHIEHDDDMDAIRGREDFKELVVKYKAKLAERLAEYDLKVEEPVRTSITEVPITRRSGGTFNVDCSVNGLALNMIFDTGASDVTISKVEADFMLKNDYLRKDDIKGKRYYQVADGGISEGTVITLREVKIGDAVLHNVDASVVKSQNAPILLGESVLERFGTFTVDNINSRLIIKY